MKDKLFRGILRIAAFVIVLISAGMVLALISGAVPALKEYGLLRFLSSTQWNVKVDGVVQYGALPFVVGTLITSFLALLFCLPLSLPVALFTGEYFKDRKIAKILRSIIDLLAGIPSVVYGLCGFYMLRPALVALGWSEQGFGILTASIVLSIMIIPYAASLSAEFVGMVPKSLKEGAYSLGATRAEVVQTVVLPYARTGIISAYILALGRALGETMAVTMLIGNTNLLPHGITDTGNTMASLIANQFGEADGTKLSALIAIGLLLFLITAIINLIGRLLIRKVK